MSNLPSVRRELRNMIEGDRAASRPLYPSPGNVIVTPLINMLKTVNHCSPASWENQGQNMEWSFHLPGASHMNGACERMICTIRKVLTGMLTDRCRLTNDIINTLFTDVEAIVNHRPLTKVNDDVADDIPLTPAHLLMVRCSPQDSGNVISTNTCRNYKNGTSGITERED